MVISNMRVQIVYHDKEMPKLELVGGAKSNCYDLYTSEEVSIKAGESKQIPLGVSMRLPDGYEAHLAPRSSTFKNFGIMQTNSFGIIDNSYSGTNDIWKFQAYAVRDTTIPKYSRICQFRIEKIQPEFDFEEVEFLGGVQRGGFGSTGKGVE